MTKVMHPDVRQRCLFRAVFQELNTALNDHDAPGTGPGVPIGMLATSGWHARTENVLED